MWALSLILELFMLTWLPGLADSPGAKILDLQHRSKVLGENRNYRIFLPPDYETSPGKRYPVIYFFHGWGERFNVGTREGAGAYDSGDDYHGDNIANFVGKHPVIVVKWDGYNPRTPDEKYPRPYNIGPVETYRQFPLYFPELVEYIDSTYRTIPDRDHRAVSGLSMGGFMSFWVAGKYPHLVGSASNFMGSPEFVVGPREFPSEYLHADMYRNYEGVRTRLVMGTKDFIRWYHARMNLVWDFARSDYEHETFDWDHGTPGMAKQLQFHMDAFAHPLPRPQIWHHVDVYPDFEVWGYSVSTDRHRPGFTILENVGPSGFCSSVREWLWDGQTMPSVSLNITTDAGYKPNTAYRVTDRNLLTGTSSIGIQDSDAAGRLHIRLDGDQHEVGIVESESPVLTLAGFEIVNAQWAVAGSEVDLRVRVLNKGIAEAREISARLSSPNPGVAISNASGRIAALTPGERRAVNPVFRFQVGDPDRAIARFDLELKEGARHTWRVPLEVRLFGDVKELENVQIADGRVFKYQCQGNKTEEKLLGVGNGDGELNPGESFVALVQDVGEFRLMSLFSNDSCVNPSGLNLRYSDYWGNYDHVGGSAKYSMPTISASCPPGREIVFFGEYLIPRAPEHMVRRGLVKVRVKGTDTTAPKARFAELSPGRVLEVGVIEGGVVKNAVAKLTRVADPSFEVVVELNDSGVRGDRAARDSIFSGVVPDLPQGNYNVSVKLTDGAGNEGTDSFKLTL